MDLTGEIYIIKNLINNMCYVGQTVKYTGKDKRKRGTNGRWKAHCKEAMAGGTSSPYLYNAMRKYGIENFSVEKLCDCSQDEMNDMEIKMIYHYKSLYPDGYNMDTGGSKGLDSDETKSRKSLAHKNYKPTIESVQRSRVSQIGKRRDMRNDNLPEYIYARRNTDGEILYYYVSFYTDKTLKKKSYKRFYTFDEANIYLHNLLERLRDVVAEVEKFRNMKNEPKVIIKNCNEDLPEHVHPYYQNQKLCGYIVKGLKDKDGNEIPQKLFIECQNKFNLQQAKKYINMMKLHGDNISGGIDYRIRGSKDGIENVYLPRYVLQVKDRQTSSIIGYCIDSLPIVVDGIVKRYNKHFTSKKVSLNEKYQMTLKHLEEVKQKYQITESALNSRLEKSATC
jgi:hypothetical protein